jgi:ubiquitin-activating enzyme E1
MSLNKTEIDESLYSRQLYAIGKDTTLKLINSKVLVWGVRGPIVEILKNIILCGVGEVTIYDNQLMVNEKDLDYIYYLNKKDLNKPILDLLGKRLSELNPNVKLNKISKNKPSINFMKKYNLVVFGESIVNQEILEITDELHKLNIPYILTNTYGVFGSIFCDFGRKFISHDINGEKILSGTIIESKNNIFICQKIHNLSKFMHINLIKGDIKKNAVVTRLVNSLSFETNISGEFEEFEEIKIPETFIFKSLRDSINSPEFVLTDYKNFDLSQTLHDFILRKNDSTESELNKKLSKILEKQIQFIPINSVIGGLAAHSIMCGLSNKYTPIKQFLYFGCLELIDMFLEKSYEKFNEKIFIVGSGALGCEHLKNLASYGFDITITDMDSIEKSNLNRQFLFRNSDIGKSKSVSAKNAILKMFPHAKITSHENKVSEETKTFYNKNFFSHMSAVINALDNVPARIYVDSQCVSNNIPLFESGTLGTKGNVQIILPNLTESYGSTVDVAEEEIPICTIKNHPYLIEHCVQWAKELFSTLFIQPFMTINKFNENNKIDKIDTMNETEINEIFETLELFTIYKGSTHTYIMNKFEEIFYKNIEQLLQLNPLDKIDETGKAYWSGTRKVPIKIDIKSSNSLKLIKDFFDSYGEIISRIISTQINLKEFSKKSKKDCIKKVLSELKGCLFNIEEFEKDDERNSHVKFISACANLRASNYHIKNVSRFEIKGIAGKIIPALSTTTSVISGIVSIEYFKYLHLKKYGNLKVEYFNNYYISMGIQYYGNSDLICCKNKRVGSLEYNIWTSFKSSAKNIKELLEEYESKNIKITCISLNNKTLYSDFMVIKDYNKNNELKRGIVLDILFHSNENEIEDEFIQIEMI